MLDDGTQLLETTDTTYRFGRPDGSTYELLRVTAALRLVTPQWARIPAEVLARAKQRGRAVHKAIWLLESQHCGGLAWESLHPELRPYVEAYLAAKMRLGLEILASERLVTSRRYACAGTLDLVGFVGRREILLDLKTGVEDPVHALQTAAYAEFLKDEDGLAQPPERWILYLKSDGTSDLRQFLRQDHRRDFGIFTNILRAAQWLAAHGGLTWNLRH